MSFPLGGRAGASFCRSAGACRSVGPTHVYIHMHVCADAGGRAPRRAFSFNRGRGWPGRGIRCGGGMGARSDLKMCEQFQRLSGLPICNVDMVAPNWPSWGANTAPPGADGMAL